MSLPEMYLLYSMLLAMVLLLGLPYWLFEMLRHGKYCYGFGQRLGAVPEQIRNSGQRSIWVHAVSVGEVLAVSELVRQLRSRFPKHRVVVSTTTDTGQRLAAARFGAGNVFYFPIDFRFSMRSYFSALRPDLIVIAETEFWPNFLRMARNYGARIAIVNARISDRSLPGYRRWRTFLGRVLAGVDLFLAQTAEDARRLTEIGAPSDCVFLGGNLKFDVPAPAPPPIVDRIRTSLAESAAGPVLVCGSTVDGEELLLLGAFKNVLASYPVAVMLLAPRRPERFDEVSGLLRQLNVKFWRRSLWAGDPLNGSVLLVDSIGELSSLYALADVAFVGGSLVPRGGHSIIEPAQHGVAIVVGNHTENFRDIVGLFQSRDAVRIVGPAELPLVLMELLADTVQRATVGRNARETLDSQRGATQFTLQKLHQLMNPGLHQASST
jgi:3-deoxy-D-manno-octulosonic-acid transferase